MADNFPGDKSLHKDALSLGVEDCCVICLDRISEQAESTPCGHKSFDYVCLLSWLEQRPACPLCNAEITGVYYHLAAGQKRQIYNVPPPKAPSVEKPLDARSDITSRHRGGFRQRRPYIPHLRLDPDEAILCRRYIYQHKLYCLHVGSNRVSRFRDLTPQLFSSDTELVSRARKWIRRELQVFVFLAGAASEPPNPNTRAANNTEFLLEYIIAILKTVDTQGSGGQAEDMLQEFLGRENTRHFLHELRAWLRSPYTSLEDWDRHVQYPEPPHDRDEATSDSERQLINVPSSGGGNQGAGRERSFVRSSRYTPYNIRGLEAPNHARRWHTPG
jgi:Ring finger domain